jgi:hypothetical protein
VDPTNLSTNRQRIADLASTKLAVAPFAASQRRRPTYVAIWPSAIKLGCAASVRYRSVIID